MGSAPSKSTRAARTPTAPRPMVLSKSRRDKDGFISVAFMGFQWRHRSRALRPPGFNLKLSAQGRNFHNSERWRGLPASGGFTRLWRRRRRSASSRSFLSWVGMHSKRGVSMVCRHFRENGNPASDPNGYAKCSNALAKKFTRKLSARTSK